MQFLRTLVATHLDRFAPNFDFDGIRVEFVIARRASLFSHDISPDRNSGTRVVGHV